MKHLPNILIVDDNQINLTYLEVVISKMKVNLVKALSGAEALEKSQNKDLALAILDVMMPGMNGYELAQKLNQERSGEKVPVIFITAKHVNEEDEFQGYNSGAVDYIFKPVSNQVLLGKIKVFLDLFEQKQTIARQVELLKNSAEKLIRSNDALRKREEKLKREQQFSSALLQSIPGIFFLYTYPEMRMVTWNKQHESIFGYEASE
ncbi:MAG TPA: response regulator, partial [Bacteroidales bacterium]|nr:response regulator [Bacteroidales bacterium]